MNVEKLTIRASYGIGRQMTALALVLSLGFVEGCAFGGAAPAVAAGVGVAEYGKFKQDVRERLEYLHTYEPNLQPRTAEAIARGQIESVQTAYQNILDGNYSFAVRAEALYQLALIQISALNPNADVPKGMQLMERVVEEFRTSAIAGKAARSLNQLKSAPVATGELPR